MLYFSHLRTFHREDSVAHQCSFHSLHHGRRRPSTWSESMSLWGNRWRPNNVPSFIPTQFHSTHRFSALYQFHSTSPCLKVTNPDRPAECMGHGWNAWEQEIPLLMGTRKGRVCAASLCRGQTPIEGWLNDFPSSRVKVSADQCKFFTVSTSICRSGCARSFRFLDIRAAATSMGTGEDRWCPVITLCHRIQHLALSILYT